MFDTPKNTISNRWFPGLQSVRDRWGAPVGPSVRSHAVGRDPAREAREALNRTQWSLGLM